MRRLRKWAGTKRFRAAEPKLEPCHKHCLVILLPWACASFSADITVVDTWCSHHWTLNTFKLSLVPCFIASTFKILGANIQMAEPSS